MAAGRVHRVLLCAEMQTERSLMPPRTLKESMHDGDNPGCCQCRMQRSLSVRIVAVAMPEGGPDPRRIGGLYECLSLSWSQIRLGGVRSAALEIPGLAGATIVSVPAVQGSQP